MKYRLLILSSVLLLFNAPLIAGVVYKVVGNTTTADAANPRGPWVFTQDWFQGASQAGNNAQHGTAFRFNPASGAVVLLYSFTGGNDDGSQSGYGAIRSFNNFLHGVTYGGGTSEGGTIFRINGNNTDTILHKSSPPRGSTRPAPSSRPPTPSFTAS